MRDLDWSDVVADGERMAEQQAAEDRLGAKIAWDRAEEDSCTAGTPGCCVDHEYPARVRRMLFDPTCDAPAREALEDILDRLDSRDVGCQPW